jgi:hypothetical protein
LSLSAAVPVDRGRPSAIVPTTLLVLTAAATVMTTIGSNGSLAAAVAPVLVVTGLCAIWRAPLRKTLLVLILLGLALDKPGDTEGLWQSPVAPLGGLLIANLNKSVDIPVLAVSLLVLLLVYLLFVRLARLTFGPRAAEPGAGGFATPMRGALAMSFLTAIGLIAYGLARGGDPQMSKIQLQVFLPLLLMTYLLGVSLRGASDYRRLAVVIVAAAGVKAAMVLWVRLTLPVSFGEGQGQLPYATTHGDSMLFACAVAILAAIFIETPVRRNGRWLLLILPLLLAAIVANNRRLAWVEVVAASLLLLMMNPRGRVARALATAAVWALPVVLIYGAAGWHSTSKIFSPVRFVRSMTDASVNRSTLYRDGENYNLIYTLRANPLLGTGFGRPFEENQPLDDISGSFKEWRYLPHNAVLGLWAFAGVIGFTGLWSVLVVGLLLAARSHRYARSSGDRIAASAAMAGIAVYLIHCWGDIGFTEPKSIFLVGAALAVAGQLAVSTGAWSVTGRGAPSVGQCRV